MKIGGICLGVLLLVRSGLGFSAETTEHHHEHEHDEEEIAPSNVGQGKGVVAASQAGGFRLSVEAYRHLGIRSEELPAVGGAWTLPVTALAAVKREHFIYLEKAGFFRAIAVSLLRRSGARAVVRPEQGPIPSGKIVTQGVPFLRNIEVDIFSGEAAGHHH